MQTITTSWFVQGMIKATSDAWLKGWDERNGGNLTLRLDDADIERLNTYHKDVYETISPYMNEEEKEWLKHVTREISR